MQEEMLTELFSIPVGLKKVVKVDDVDLYTSDSLIKNFKKSISDSVILQVHYDKISSLVDRGRIIPCYINRGIIKVFLWKFLSDRSKSHNYGHVLAFFHHRTNNMYILIDNNINYTGYISNEFLGELVIHESVHMARFENTNSFYKIFSKDLTKFYSHYFKNLFQLSSISDKDVSKYVLDLLLLREKSLKEMIKITEIFLDSLKKNYEYGDIEFNKLKYNYLYICKFTRITEKTSDFYNELLKYKQIILPFYKAYKSAFDIPHRNLPFCYQELYEPSEAMCMYCEKVLPKEKISSMFSLIK
jgi:hypothetical protein